MYDFTAIFLKLFFVQCYYILLLSHVIISEKRPFFNYIEHKSAITPFKKVLKNT